MPGAHTECFGLCRLSCACGIVNGNSAHAHNIRGFATGMRGTCDGDWSCFEQSYVHTIVRSSFGRCRVSCSCVFVDPGSAHAHSCCLQARMCGAGDGDWNIRVCIGY